jgi:hypothetical protein
MIQDLTILGLLSMRQMKNQTNETSFKKAGFHLGESQNFKKINFFEQ